MTFDAWFSSTSLVLIRISRLNSSLKFGMECVYVLPTSEKFYNVSSEKHFRAVLKLPFKKVVSRKRKLYIGLNSLCWPTSALQKSKVSFKNVFLAEFSILTGLFTFLTKLNVRGKLAGNSKCFYKD